MKKLSQILFVLLCICSTAIPIQAQTWGEDLSQKMMAVTANKKSNVKDFESFHQNLIDPEITEINLQADIILEHTTPIQLTHDKVINGNGHTLIEGDSLAARVQVATGVTLSINDVTVHGRNKYGTFSTIVGIKKHTPTIILNNYHYFGPKLIYNPDGTTIFRGNNIGRLQKQTVLSDQSDDISEIGVVANLIFDTASTLAVDAQHTGKQEKHAAFWFRGEQNALQIKDDANINIQYPHAFSLFYQYDNAPLHLGKRAKMDIHTEDILYGGYAFSEVILAKAANLNFQASSEHGSLHCSQNITLDDGAQLAVKNGGNHAPLTVAENGNITIGNDATLRIERIKGEGLFSNESNKTRLNILHDSDILAKQDDDTFTWQNVTAEIFYDGGNTKVKTADPMLNTILDLEKNKVFHVKPSIELIKDKEKFLTYEKGITKTEQLFFDDLALTNQDVLQLESDFDEAWIHNVGEYESLVRVNNLNLGTSYFIKVYIHVVDTTAPVIFIRPDVATRGITYYLPVNKSEEEFLQDIDARTDDGSLITSDYTTQVDQQQIGEYDVHLDAVDDFGNHAQTKQVKVIVSELSEQTNFIIQADDFITHSSTLQRITTPEAWNEFLLKSSNAQVVETVSNQAIYHGISTKVVGDIIYDTQTTNVYDETNITKSGLVEYGTANNIADQKVNKLYTGTLKTSVQKNSFIYAKTILIYVLFLTLIIVFLVGYYLYARRKE